MRNSFLHRICVWHVVALAWVAVALCVGYSVSARAETADSSPVKELRLEDGTLIELTEDAVIRRGPEPDTAQLWAIPAKQPQLPLLFEDRYGVRLLLYFMQIEEHYGEFHALRVEDGQEQWMHPMWIGYEEDQPVSPVFLNSWIYFGRGIWLEKMNPEDGTLVERYPARAIIKSLQPLAHDTLKISIETAGVGDLTLHFQDSQFSPHIAAPADVFASVGLFSRSKYVKRDFFTDYLKLHKIEKYPPSTEFVLQLRNFDLHETEETYRNAYRKDLANPYFALYLALSLYYQDREQEAMQYFQDALLRSRGFWEESFRMGSVCESLRLPQWADRCYEQGIRDYFQEISAPQQKVNWPDIAILLFQQQSEALFALGEVERAIHVINTRRQIFPYTEGDSHFSRQYANWLRLRGQPEKAVIEEQRIGQIKYFEDFEELSPDDFGVFAMSGLLVLVVILLKNERQNLYRLGQSIQTAFEQNNSFRSFLSLFWQNVSGVIVSSYITILGGAGGVYASCGIGAVLFGGKILRQHPYGFYLFLLLLGITEIGFLLGFIKARQWIRKSYKNIFPLRNLKSFVLLGIVLIFHGAWYHVHLGIIAEESSMPFPSNDWGHPNWRAYIDQEIEDALFHYDDLLFTQALFHQLNGDIEFARERYEGMSNDARALNNLGVIALKQNPADARNYFEQALKLDSDSMPARHNLSMLDDNRQHIEHVSGKGSWLEESYHRHTPGKPRFAIPTRRELCLILYWSRGGVFLVMKNMDVLPQGPDDPLGNELKRLHWEHAWRLQKRL